MSYSFVRSASTGEEDAVELLANVGVKEPSLGFRRKELAVEFKRDTRVAIDFTVVEFDFEHLVGGIITHRRQRR